MDPIKPVDRATPAAQEQALAAAQLLQQRYWQQRARDAQAVEASSQAAETAEKPKKSQTEQKWGNFTHTYAEFEVNKDSGEIVVRIIDAESGELVRTIPPDQLAKEIAQGQFKPQQLRSRAVLV